MSTRDEQTPRRIRTSSGAGQFIARIQGDTLTVTLPVDFTFVPGNPDVVPGWPTDQYQWTSKQKKRFAARFKRTVKKTWSRKYSLVEINDPRRIEVDVDVEEVAHLEDALWRIFVGRYPCEAIDTEASVCSPGQSHFSGSCAGNPTGQNWGTVIFASNHVRCEFVQNREVNSIEIPFPRLGERADSALEAYDREVFARLSRPQVPQIPEKS